MSKVFGFIMLPIATLFVIVFVFKEDFKRKTDGFETPAFEVIDSSVQEESKDPPVQTQKASQSGEGRRIPAPDALAMKQKMNQLGTKMKIASALEKSKFKEFALISKLLDLKVNKVLPEYLEKMDSLEMLSDDEYKKFQEFSRLKILNDRILYALAKPAPTEEELLTIISDYHNLKKPAPKRASVVKGK